MRRVKKCATLFEILTKDESIFTGKMHLQQSLITNALSLAAQQALHYEPSSRFAFIYHYSDERISP